jgi:hypothetical protein
MPSSLFMALAAQLVRRGVEILHDCRFAIVRIDDLPAESCWILTRASGAGDRRTDSRSSCEGESYRVKLWGEDGTRALAFSLANTMEISDWTWSNGRVEDALISP